MRFYEKWQGPSKDKLRVSLFVTKRLTISQINKNGDEKDKNKTGHYITLLRIQNAFTF